MNSLLKSFLDCRSRLARMVGRIVRPDEIEDILQEAFITSYAASRQQEILNPQAFMVRVARNLALDHIGRAEQRLNCSLEDIAEEFLVAEQDPERQHQSRESFLEFCRAVSTLPASCRRAFILQKVYGLTLDEIGAYLGISRSTVEKHVAKGLCIVVEHMQRQGQHSAVSSNPRRGTQR